MAKKRIKGVLPDDEAVHEAPPRDLPKFWNDAQRRFWDTISANTVTFCIGPAGTSKTHISVTWAEYATRRKEYGRIIFTRPIVEATESLGWLPGTVEQRTAPFMRPMQEVANKVKLVEPAQIEAIPLAYMRGLTLDSAVCVLDEAQNVTRSQLKLYLTRLGRGSKMIICGDTDQSDINDSGLAWAIRKLGDIPGIGVFEFTKDDIVRHPLVSAILEKWE